MTSKKFLTAADVAALCECDMKTIHNWVERGRIQHFKTPGRHLRFLQADVVAFLKKTGFPVPVGLEAEPSDLAERCRALAAHSFPDDDIDAWVEDAVAALKEAAAALDAQSGGAR